MAKRMDPQINGQMGILQIPSEKDQDEYKRFVVLILRETPADPTVAWCADTYAPINSESV